MRITRLKHIRMGNRRALIMALAVIVIGMAVAYVLWSKQTWAAYEPQSEQWQQDHKVQIDRAVGMPTKSNEERVAALAALTAVSNRIDSSKEEVCRAHLLVQWQGDYIDSLSAKLKSCQGMTATAGEFTTQLNKVIAYLQADQALAEVLSKIPRSDTLADGKWEDQVTLWGAAAQNAKDLSVSDDFRPVQQLVVERLSGVKIAWQGVISAHKAKDKKKYLAAQDKLSAAYDGMTEVSVASNKTIAVLGADLQTKYVTTFEQ